ncbi:hypothetical protein [Blautia producta]|nr:hypothetical protein [Blautia producta]
MQMEELLKKRELKGREIEKNRLKELAFKLSGDGREKEFIEAASNPNLLEKLYQEYGI